MKIRSKLVISYIIIAIISIFFASYFAINSVTSKYKKAEIEKLQGAKKLTQASFYNQMTELKRKAIIFSGLSDFSTNINNESFLNIFLNTKEFLLQNINLKILNKKENMIFLFENSETKPVKNKHIKKTPFFGKNVDPYLRKSGVFKFDGNIYIMAKSPIVDQDTFEIKAYLLLEQPVNQFFGDMLKEKAKSEIIIISDTKKISTTILDYEAKNYFPKTSVLRNKEYPSIINIKDEKYLISKININDYNENKIGEIFVCNNIQQTLGVQKVFIRNFLFLALIIALILVFAGIFIARKLSLPLLKLSNSAKRLSTGDYNTRVNVSSSDEIGKLAEVFNNMVKSLKHQRKEILYLQQFFETIVENSPSGIIICDNEFSVVNMNSEAERTFQIKKEKTINKNLFTSIPIFKNFFDNFIDIYKNGITRFVDDFEYKRDNEEIILRFAFYKISIQEKDYIGIQTEDITERIKIEERLVHANKLSSLGELLTKFVHEYNNLVSGIIGNIELLIKQVKDDKLIKKIKKIKTLVLKSKNLSSNILDFSRKRKFIKQKIDIVKTTEDVIDLLESTALKNIEVEKEYSSKELYFNIDREKISLVLFNLLLNAKDAVEEASEKRNRIKIIIKKTKIKKKPYLSIMVSDNGVGIERNKVDKIFQRFYTTKKEKGTGLGLANVKEITEEYRGFVELETEPGKGSCFKLFLPEEN